MTSYEQASQLFLTKLQLACTQSNASIAVIQSCLHDISCNLGLVETVDAFRVGERATSLPHFRLHHQEAASFQPGRVSRMHISSSDASGLVPHPQLQASSPLLEPPVNSTPYPGPRISSQPLYMHSFDDSSHESDVAASALVELPKATGMHATTAVNSRDSNTTLQNGSGGDNTDTGKKLVRRKLFENETEMTPLSNVSTDERSPPATTSDMKSSAVTASQKLGSRNFSSVYAHHSCGAGLSPTEMCSCVDPSTVHQIKEVQQKLASLSSSSHNQSLHDTTKLHDPLLPNFPNPKGRTPVSEPEVADTYPILTPPPGFVTQNTDETDKLQVDFGPHKHGHLQLGLSPISSHSRLPHYTTTQSLTSQIYPVDSSSTFESVVHENQFFTCTPKALQQLHHAVKYMQLYPCSKAFRIWRRYAQKQTALREKSVQIERRARLQKMGDMFSTWKNQSARLSHLRELELQHHRRVDFSTLKACFATWKARTERKLADQEAELQAISYHTSVCLKKHFVCWRLAYQSLILETTAQV